MSAQRLDPGEARRDVDSGDALLVCAYDDEEKCQNYALPNALLLSELSAKEKTLPKDRDHFLLCLTRGGDFCPAGGRIPRKRFHQCLGPTRRI